MIILKLLHLIYKLLKNIIILTILVPPNLFPVALPFLTENYQGRSECMHVLLCNGHHMGVHGLVWVRCKEIYDQI